MCCRLWSRSTSRSTAFCLSRAAVNICWYVQLCSCPSHCAAAVRQRAILAGNPQFFRHVAEGSRKRPGVCWVIKYPPDQWPDLGQRLAQLWNLCQSRQPGWCPWKCVVCVSTLLFLFFSLFCHKLCWNPIQSSKFQSWKKAPEKESPVCCYVDFLELGQRDPACYDFNGRGSARPDFVGGYFWLVHFGASLLKKKHGVPMRLSQNPISPTSVWTNNSGYPGMAMEWVLAIQLIEGICGHFMQSRSSTTFVNA